MNTKRILIVGAGRIGTSIRELIKNEKYEVTICDLLDDVKGTDYTDVFAAVPYFAIEDVAKFAASIKANYYDFTEHVGVRDVTRDIFRSKFGTEFPVAMVNGCGVAPGICNIIAGQLMRQMDEITSVSMCVGGVPFNREINKLHYYNIWSLDGLWNLYFGNPVEWKLDGKKEVGKFGAGYRRINVLGKEYEAFITGGTTVDELFDSGVRNVAYSTIRHVGHVDRISELNKTLDFENNPQLFKTIIDSMPKDARDEVVMSIQVTGWGREGEQVCLRDDRIFGTYGNLGAMMYSTALGGLIAMDNVYNRNLKGIISQEDLLLKC